MRHNINNGGKAAGVFRAVRAGLAAVLAVGLSAALSACTPSPAVVEGSAVVIAVTHPFTSYNLQTGRGATNSTNAALVEVTSSTFFSYDADGRLQPHAEWGSARVVSDDPFRVEYSLTSDARWSDGVPVDSADLLLAWAANSGALNDEGIQRDEVIDPESGELLADADPGVVFFDGDRARGLAHATQLPEVGGDGRSVTLTFDTVVPDWRLIGDVGLAAHQVGEKAGSEEEPADVKSRVQAAIVAGDRAALAELSHTWNAAYTWDENAEPQRELVGSGPYSVTSVVAAETTVLTANPHYRGERKPTIETITLRYFDDETAAVEALRAGSVDVVGELRNPETLATVRAESEVTVQTAPSGEWERLDVRVQHSRSGTLEDPLIREAFLLTVPRDDIVEELIHPLAPEAQARGSFLFPTGTAGEAAAREAEPASHYRAADPDRARTLVSEQEYGGAREVCILFDPASPQRHREFNLIKDAGNAVGFDVTDCSTPEWRELLALDGTYDAALYSVRETNRSAASVQAMFSSDSQVYRTSQLSNPELDAAIELLASNIGTPSEDETREAIDSLLWAEHAGLPLYDVPQVVAHAQRVTIPSLPIFASSAVAHCWSWTLEDR